MRGPLRWWRDRRADRAARAAMSDADRAVVAAFAVPPRMTAGHGSYANAAAMQAEAAALRPWPDRPGVMPVSVSHTRACEPWSLSGRSCPRECKAPDRRVGWEDRP